MTLLKFEMCSLPVSDIIWHRIIDLESKNGLKLRLICPQTHYFKSVEKETSKYIFQHFTESKLQISEAFNIAPSMNDYFL